MSATVTAGRRTAGRQKIEEKGAAQAGAREFDGRGRGHGVPRWRWRQGEGSVGGGWPHKRTDPHEVGLELRTKVATSTTPQPSA